MIEKSDVYEIITTLILTIAAVFLLWKLGSVILLFLTALMLSAALNPIVARLSKKMPAGMAIGFVILIIVVPLLGALIIVLPDMIKQTPEIISSVNSAFQNSTLFPGLKSIDLSSLAQQSGQYILHSSGKIAGGVTSFITFFVLAIYLLIDGKSLRKLFIDLLPRSRHEKVNNFLDETSKVSGDYIRGNLLISLICSGVILVGLLILKVPYAPVLAVLTGALDLLPLVGGLIGAVLPVVLAFTISPLTGFLTIILFVVYQQVENNLLAPKIYNKTLNLSPALGLMAVIIGASLYGIPGAFIALPIAASVPATIKYLRKDE